VHEALAVLEGWGLRPRPLPAEGPRHLYLAGTDAQRAGQFQALYGDPEIKALFATRGGYGAARMLPLLDAAAIAAAPPKAVVGMSDVVALFAYLHAVAGVGAIHGPCLAAPGTLHSPQREANLADLRSLLFGGAPPPALPCRVLRPGPREDAAGPVLGGNLAVLAACLGTPWAPDTRGAILFFEEVREAPYRIDRYLTQFRLAGWLAAPAAVVFGQMHECDGDPPGLLEEVLADLFRDAPFPVLTGLEAGHGARNHSLPLGRSARLCGAGGAKGGEALLAFS
jgi:muramoyltetrapeptide carboxypeptidase